MYAYNDLDENYWLTAVTDWLRNVVSTELIGQNVYYIEMYTKVCKMRLKLNLVVALFYVAYT